MDSHVLLTFLCMDLIKQGATKIPVIDANLGSDVILICPYRGDNVQWNGPPNHNVYTIGSQINPSLEKRNRLDVVGDSADGEYNLRIANTSHADNGLYSCTLTQQHNLRLQIIERIVADVDEDVCISFHLDFDVSLEVSFIRFNSSIFNVTLVKIIVIIGRTLPDSVAFTENRFLYTGNSTDKLIGFCIRNLTRNDSGVYYLDIKHKNIRFIANLTVYLPLESVEIFYTSDIIEEDSISVLRCETTSYPVASVEWSKDSKIILSPISWTVDGDTMISLLYYKADRKDHKRTVRCVATNNLTSVVSDGVILNVLYSPEVSIQASSESLVQVIGQTNLQFTCSVVNSNPTVILYKWFLNGTLLLSETGNTFIIHSVSLKHNGTFGCKADNGIGEGMTANARLVVLSIPSPKVTDMICNSSSTVTLACNLEGYKDFYIPFQWQHISGKGVIRTLQGKQANGLMTLTIEFCNYQDLGMYMCFWKGAKHGLGFLNNTGTLQVKGAPIIADSKTFETESSFLISVYFYSDPYPYDPVWFHDNKPLVYGSDFHKSTGKETIELTSYDTKMKVSGFITNLTIVKKEVGMTYTCMLENSFGSNRKSVKIPVSESDEASLSPGTLAGIAIGSVCTVTFVTTLIVYLMYGKRKNTSRGTKYKDVDGKTNEGCEQYDMIGTTSPPSIYEQLNSPPPVYNEIEN